MSDWLHFDLEINKDSKVSVRRAVENIWGKGEVSVTEDFVYHNGNITFKVFHVSTSQGGVQRLYEVSTLLDNIKSIDNKSNPIITITNLVVY